MKGERGRFLSHAAIANDHCKLTLPTEFSGTLVGFDDYVSTYIVPIVVMSKDNLS
jgi:hypothetical protein